VSTEVEGLDDILGGGLPQGQMYLLEGGPGTGKAEEFIGYAAADSAAAADGMSPRGPENSSFLSLNEKSPAGEYGGAKAVSV